MKAAEDFYLAFHKMELINILLLGPMLTEIGQIAMAAIAMALEVDASAVAPF